MKVTAEQAVAAAKVVEQFCAQGLHEGADDKGFSVTRPAQLCDELRFFLDVYDPSWRPRMVIGAGARSS